MQNAFEVKKNGTVMSQITNDGEIYDKEDNLSLDIQHGVSGTNSWTIKTRTNSFGNILVFGGDGASRNVLHIFYSTTEVGITAIQKTYPNLSFSVTFNPTTQEITLTSNAVIYGGLTFIQ